MSNIFSTWLGAIHDNGMEVCSYCIPSTQPSAYKCNIHHKNFRHIFFIVVFIAQERGGMKI